MHAGNTLSEIKIELYYVLFMLHSHYIDSNVVPSQNYGL